MTKPQPEPASLERLLAFETLQERLSVLEALTHDLSNTVGSTFGFLELAARDQNGKTLARLVTAAEQASRSMTSLKRLMWELADLRSEAEHARKSDLQLKSAQNETQGVERRSGIEGVSMDSPRRSGQSH